MPGTAASCTSPARRGIPAPTTGLPETTRSQPIAATAKTSRPSPMTENQAGSANVASTSIDRVFMMLPLKQRVFSYLIISHRRRRCPNPPRASTRGPRRPVRRRQFRLAAIARPRALRRSAQIPDCTLAGSQTHRAPDPKSQNWIVGSRFRSMRYCPTVFGAWEEPSGKSLLRRICTTSQTPPTKGRSLIG